MLPRWCLTTLAFALPLLAITFGVLLGAAELIAALGDTNGAYAVRCLAIADLLILVIDAICLLTVLGLAAVAERSDQAD